MLSGCPRAAYGRGAGMDTGEGLPDGARVAVVGGGLAAAAVAAALGIAGRMRGRSFSIHVHDPESPRAHRPPVLLTSGCRTDLAALGCRIPNSWNTTPLRAVIAHQGGSSVALPLPPTPLLWIQDAALLRQALAASASLHGAIFLGRKVDSVEHLPERGTSTSRGPWVVRARGRADRYHAVIFATGLASGVTRRAWRRYRPPPAVRVVTLRLSGPSPRDAPAAHVLLLPAPGLTALELFPEQGGWFAAAWGPSATPESLGTALARAWAEGLLPEGLQPGLPTSTWHPAGSAGSLATRGLLAVGNAALGHPLEHGLGTLLAGCSSAAHALVQYGPDAAAMVHAHAVEGQRAALQRTRDSARAAAALHRAGPRALEAVTAAAKPALPWLSTAPGCFGLLQPPPSELAAAARALGFRRRLRGLLLPPVPELPRPRMHAESPHVLLVESDAGRAYRLSAALARRGARCTVMEDGLGLLVHALRESPTAVVLGTFLPWMDSRSLCRALRASPETSTLPVIALGDRACPFARQGLEEAGAHWVDADGAFEEPLAAYLVPEPCAEPAADPPGINASYGGTT